MGNELYERYEKLRDIKGYTDYKVAKLAGIKGTATISNWKNGKYTPKDDKMHAIATVLGVTFDYLKGNADMVICPICGFGDNPLSEQSRKEHNLFHNQFLAIQNMFPQYMPLVQAEKLRSESINKFWDEASSLDDKIDAFDNYLKASFTQELSRIGFDELKYISYDDYCKHEVGKLRLNQEIEKELKDKLIEKYGVSYDYDNADELLIERARNNDTLMRLLSYAEKLNPELQKILELQAKALSEQNPEE